MKNKNTYVAFLLGLMIGLGSTVYADQITVRASDDSFVNGFVPDDNYGSHTFARLRWQSEADWGRNFPLYKFDLSELPPLVWINWARMRFYVGLTDDDSDPGWSVTTNFCPVAVYKNLEDWDEVTVTYNNRPACTSNVVQELEHFGLLGVDDVFFTYYDYISSGGWLEYWDGSEGTGIRDLVQEWADGSNNYGVTIKGTTYYVTDPSRYFDLQTKENPAAVVRPSIIIDYMPVPEPASVSLLVVLAAGVLAVRRRFKL